jgi:drug/metabolite transporter (DMT)-like permease
MQALKSHSPYRGIGFMLIAAFCFSCMGASAKLLKGVFTAGQLVFYRNLVGLIFLAFGFLLRPPRSEGGKMGWLIFRGFMGTIALYTLLFCVLHMPLGTAMTYNLTSAIFIALFSYVLFGEFHGPLVLSALLIGFTGMILVYKPSMHLPGAWHLAGLISGITSAIAYLTVGRLSRYYDPRVIVSAFIVTGVILPLLSLGVHAATNLPADGLFIIDWKIPHGLQWVWILMLGLFALFGQYFVTRAYGTDKAGVVSAVSYANIVFSVIFGYALGDGFPDPLSLTGILLIISSGIMISMYRSRPVSTKA